MISTNRNKRITAFFLMLITLLSSLAVFNCFADEEEGNVFENDRNINVSVTASKPADTEETEGGIRINSKSAENYFNVMIENSIKERTIHLEYTINGKTKNTKSKYFTYATKTEEDYGTIELIVYNNDNEIIAKYEIELVLIGSNAFINFFEGFFNDLYDTFIKKDRWKTIVKGFGNTMLITLASLIFGILIGVVIAAIRSTYDKNKESYAQRGGAFKYLMKFLNFLCNIYLTVIRGTPVVVQLLIMYFIIFAGGNDLLIAIFAFGINSGAYVAEILRGGIMAVDNGQFEAGRSLGFNYFQTMIYIVIPQMFKSSLPALCNEFIALLKETSVAGYVPIIDLTKAGNIIRSSTYTAFLPLIVVALIYLIVVIILTKLVGILERRLRKNER